MAIPLNNPGASGQCSRGEDSNVSRGPRNPKPGARRGPSSSGQPSDPPDGGASVPSTYSSLRCTPPRQEALRVVSVPMSSLEELVSYRMTREPGASAVPLQPHQETEAERINDRSPSRVVPVVATAVAPRLRLVEVSETQFLHHLHLLRKRNRELERRVLQFQRLFQDRKRLACFINGPLKRLGLKVVER